MAFLTASAIAPVAGAGLGVSAAFGVALAQLGGLGSNFLADALAGTAQRMRGTGPITEQQWRDAVAADLLPLLDAGDARGKQLQAEVSAVLHEIDAVATALTEAATADDDLRRQLEAAFEQLGSDVGSLGWMLGDVRRSIDDLRQQFAGQTFLLHRQLEEVRRQLVAVNREPLPPSPATASSEPPYPGLAAFQPADAPLFRGREAQVAELLARLSEQALGGPALVVTGVSGVGKSSLLRAGLLPAIGAGRLGPAAATWPWVLLTPGPTPLHDLINQVIRLLPPETPTMRTTAGGPPATTGVTEALADGPNPATGEPDTGSVRATTSELESQGTRSQPPEATTATMAADGPEATAGRAETAESKPATTADRPETGSTRAMISDPAGVSESAGVIAGPLATIGRPTAAAETADTAGWSRGDASVGPGSVAKLVGEVRRDPASFGRLAGEAAAAGRRPVIVVDQFEELFTQCADPAERLAFTAALTAAAPALVVIAVRSDFYPACIELPPLAGLLAAGHVVLGPLDAEALRRAVVEPAEQAGLTVDPGLPELMLRDLGEDVLAAASTNGAGLGGAGSAGADGPSAGGPSPGAGTGTSPGASADAGTSPGTGTGAGTSPGTGTSPGAGAGAGGPSVAGSGVGWGGGRGGYEPGALPLLAHALRATWERRDGDRLTVAAYRETGGIRYAVAETAERIYLGLEPDERASLRSALLSLVTVTSNGTVVRRRGQRDAGNSRVLDRLVAGRLVTAGTDTVEISHEALLTGWPRLAGWVEDARADLELRQRVVEAAEDWERSGRDPDLLLRGSRLLSARERLTDAGSLPGPAPVFLAEGAAAAEQGELARRRATGRLRRLVAGLGVALLLAVAGGLVAFDKQRVAAEKGQEAQDSRRVTASRQFAAEAVNALDRDEITAVRRALDGWQEAPTVEARGALLSAQMVNSIGTLGTEVGGTAAAVSPDAARIAIGYQDGTVRLWDAHTFAPVGEPMVPPDEKARTSTSSVAYSPDGRFLLSSTIAYNGLQIWDAATGKLARTLPGGAAAAWLPGTSTVVATRTDTTGSVFQFGLWDAPTGKLTRSFPVGKYFAFDLSVSRDGRYVAAGKDMTSPAQVWQLSDGRPVTTVPDTVHVAFAPDGTLVGGNRLGQLAQWSIPSGKRLRTMIPDVSTPGASRIVVTSDGHAIVNNGFRSIAMFMLADGSKTTNNTGVAVFPVPAVSPDGRLVVVTGSDAPTAVLRRATTWLPHVGQVFDSAFSPDGRQLATAADDGLVRIWDVASRDLVRSIPTAGKPGKVAYAAGGTLVDATANHRLEIRDAATGKLRETVPLVGLQTDLDVSPDGSLVAVSTSQGPDDVFTDADPKKFDQIVVYDVVRREVRARFRPASADKPTPKATGDKSIDDKEDPYAVAFSSDGSTLMATLTSNTAYIPSTVLQRWRISDLAMDGTYPLGKYQAGDIAVSPVDGSVAVAGTNGFVEVRSADGARQLWTTPPQIQQIDSIEFSPDGRTLASTEFNGRVHLWDTGSHALAATLTGHGSRSNALAFSPDSKLLASAGFDWTFGVWRLDDAQVLSDLCQIAKIASRNDGEEPPMLCR
ncbi:AAA family ATPase [Actinoplanes sp. L3-i22]|uniref:NACHT and WD repeat domain-containing protein n=1 Tax=Actinoplanes sp. L3-i22 TaxID=2836373 RepID=UPI001C844CA4|nr:AAA family ATPase [Actinoplanes sp. L3-i22]